MTPSSGVPLGASVQARPPAPAGVQAPFGLPSGMRVMTLDGALPVEHLVPGDRIVTRKAGMARLTDHHVGTVRTEAVEIRGGAFGTMEPDAVVMLPAAQVVLLRDWRAKVMFGQPQASVPAGMLVDLDFIRDLGEVEMVLHRLIFDRAEIIYAEGLELASGPARLSLRPAA